MSGVLLELGLMQVFFASEEMYVISTVCYRESGMALKSVSLRPKAVMLTPMKFAVNRGTSVPGNIIGSGNIGTGEHRRV